MGLAPESPGPPLRLATRQSALALAQTGLVADALRAAWPGIGIELVPVITEGDRRRDVATTALGGKGVFTAAVQEAVLEGRADLAVHSAKDLPAAGAAGLVLAAAGLQRLGLRDELVAPLDPESFTPAPAQGCLAVEAREDDTRVLGLTAAITHRPSRVALRGERAFLARLGGSCTLPAGALLSRGSARLEMHGFLAAANGKGLVRERLAGPLDDPEGLGEGLAARLLDACGPEVRALIESSRRS